MAGFQAYDAPWSLPAGIQLFTTKEISSYDTFSGLQTDWEQWAVGFEAEATMRGMHAYVEAVRSDPNLDLGNLASQGPTTRAIAENLYGLFARRLRGKALTFVVLAEKGHGFQVLRDLYIILINLGAQIMIRRSRPVECIIGRHVVWLPCCAALL